MAPSGEDAAIKRVLQDKRFKVREWRLHRQVVILIDLVSL